LKSEFRVRSTTALSADRPGQKMTGDVGRTHRASPGNSMLVFAFWF
jgi:hypothetical protein